MRTIFLVFAVLSAILQAQPPMMQTGDGVWLRDAYFGEKETFDSCLAHQPGQGMYHNHVQPVCLRAQLGDNVDVNASSRTGATYRERASGWKHSPILGWALDGYPIYGPYGYSDPKNAGSPVKRMKSGYRLRQMTQRDSLPEWALGYHPGVPQQLPAAQQGPPVDERFPLGRYVEDNEFVATLGDLDPFNGRTTVTPEFPNGTYAYFITLKDDGTPAFPYILGMQYYGAVARGPASAVPAEAQDYFNNGQFTGERSTDAQLRYWQTENSFALATAIVGWDPSAGPQTTWPGVQPAGARAPGGGVTTPASADVQRIRTTASTVYVNSNNLPSYVIGPWFAGSMNGGVFMNFAASINTQVAVPRAPQAAAGARTNTGFGSVGIWVNGVAVFNAADGASYRNASGKDAGGGLVEANLIHWSSASLEGGPVTPGALVTAFAHFESRLATATETAATASWPLALGGTTVTVTDSAGVARQAEISYASPRQVNYRVPKESATALATVRITAGGVNIPGALHIVSTYPGLFRANAENAAVAQVARVVAGRVVYEAVSGPIQLGPASEQATLVLYGTGLNKAAGVTVTVGGIAAPVAYAGPQGNYPGWTRST